MRKVCPLSSRSLKVLSDLDNVLRHRNMLDVDRHPDIFVQNEECHSNNSHIIWSIELSTLIKREGYGEYVESPAIYKSTPIRKLKLYPNGRKEFYLPFISLDVQLKNLPKNMSVEGDVTILGKGTMLSETFFGHSSNLIEINFDNKHTLGSYIVNNKLELQVRIKTISQAYKCVSGKSVYEVHYKPEITNFRKLILVSEMYSDVIFHMDSGQIKCHKYILASESPALFILLRSSNRNIFDMHDKSPAVIEDLLSFIYIGGIKLLKFNQICQLYIAADDFRVLKLKDICSLFLSSNLSKKNVPYLFELSMKYKDQDLMENCIKFVKKNEIKGLKETFMERSVKIKN